MLKFLPQKTLRLHRGYPALNGERQLIHDTILKIRYSLIVALAILAVCFSSPAAAQFASPKSAGQDTTQTDYLIKLKDGTTVTGKILEHDDEFYTIKVRDLGTIRLSTDMVLSYVPVETRKGKSEEHHIYENKFTYKYFFMPTAIPVEARKFSCNTQYGMISNFYYGINKYWSVGATFLNLFPSLFSSLSTKVTINPEANIKIALTAQVLNFRVDRDNLSLGYSQVLVTKGNNRNNFTLGVGKLFFHGDFANGSIVSAGFVKSVKSKVSLMGQAQVLLGAYKTDEFYGLGCAGVRLNRKFCSFDLGGTLPFGPGLHFDQNNITPYAGFNARIGK